MRKLKTYFIAIVATFLVALAPQALLAKTADTTPGFVDANQSRQLEKEIGHRLRILPYYGVFDNLAYSIEGGKVTLHGQVVRPSTRSDAARSVAGIKGVTQVVNKIEVLPASTFDDSIRRRTYRELARTGGLYRYLQGTNPSLHIVVNRGNVTLAGVVSNKTDKRLAYIIANRVSGVFGVTNELAVEGEGQAR